MLERYLAWRTARARPPVRLGTRAARWGALAVALSLAVVAVPFLQGVRMGGDLAPAPRGDSAWVEVMRAGYHVGAGGVPR